MNRQVSHTQTLFIIEIRWRRATATNEKKKEIHKIHIFFYHWNFVLCSSIENAHLFRLFFFSFRFVCDRMCICCRLQSPQNQQNDWESERKKKIRRKKRFDDESRVLNVVAINNTCANAVRTVWLCAQQSESTRF